MSSNYKKTVVDWIEEHQTIITQAHKKAWEWAEIGLHENKTSAYFADILEKHGFTVERGVAGMPTAFVASFGEGTPVIGVMAELDALPGLSQDIVPYLQPMVKGGAGHGCGHCSYAASALGSALALKDAILRHKLTGTIKCFGCPAEETVTGKVFMVRDGFFDGLDAVIGHHPGSTNGASLGVCRRSQKQGIKRNLK